MNALRPLLASPRQQLALVLALIAALSVIKFANGFIYDDVLVILQGNRIHDITNLPGFFTHHTMWGSALEENAQNVDLSQLDTWRPITMATFVLDAQLSGRAPWAYHLTNLLAHLGVVALVFALCRRLMAPEGRPWAAVAALFFGMHPILAEAHIWINGRSDLLAALFGAGSLLLALRAQAASGWRAQVGLHAASGALLLVGCMCKEVLLMSTPLYPLAALLLPTRRRLDLKALWATLAASAAPAVAGLAYLGARTWAIGGLKAFGQPDQETTALTRIPLIVMDSLGNLLLPHDVYFRYTREEFAPYGTWWLAAAGGGLVVVLLVGWLLRRQAPALLWGLVGFALTLAPATIITTTLGWWGFNRYLYLPAVLVLPGLAQLMASAFGWLRGRERPALVGVAVGAMILYGLFEANLYVLTIRDFSDEERFYRAIVEYAPESSHGHQGIGTLLLRPGHYDEAADHLRIAYQASPYDARIRNNLLLALIQLNAQAEARPIAEESAVWWPNNVLFRNLLAMTWTDEDPRKASTILLECAQRDPENGYIFANIDYVLQHHTRSAEFRAAFPELLGEARFAALAPLLQPHLDKARDAAAKEAP